MSVVQKAAPAARRTALAIVGGGLLLLVLAIAMADELRPAFQAWIRQDVVVRLRMVMTALALLTAGPLFGLAGYLWRLGRRIVRAERYPPPGLRVTRDTIVVVGEAADRRGRLVQASALVIGLTGLFLAFFLWRLLSLVERGAA